MVIVSNSVFQLSSVVRGVVVTLEAAISPHGDYSGTAVVRSQFRSGPFPQAVGGLSSGGCRGVMTREGDEMDVLVLRLIHIGAGAFWVGAVFTFFLFVQPTAAALGPDAQKFVFHLIHHRRLPVVILSAAAVTVVAGIWLLVITSSGLDPDLLFDVSRQGYTVGGVVAIVTFGIGALYVFPRTRTVERTIGRLLAEGRPPTPDEQQTLARTARESRAAGWVVIIGLVIAVVAMATARLWGLFL